MALNPVIPNPGFKVGDKVVILNDNEGFPGGGIPGYNGKICIIKEIFNRLGYVRMKDPDFVWAFQNIRMADAKEIKMAGNAIKAIKKKALSTVLKDAINNNPGTVGYALRFTDNPDNIQHRDVCNARMHWGYDSVKKGECIEVIQDVGVKGRKVFSEGTLIQYRQYVKWLMNSSPWSPAIITKNLSNAFKYGVKFNVDKSVHQVVAAGITLREGTEFSWKLPLFSKLLAKGYSGNVAYLVSSSLKPTDGENYSYTGINMGHCTLSGEMDWKVLKEFFKNGYVLDNKEKPLRNSYAIGYRIFLYIAPTNGGNGSVFNTFHDVLSGGVKVHGFGKRGKNYSFKEALLLADFVTAELNGDLK